MKISLPKGYELPANARPGEPFEVVALITPEEDGSHKLTAIDGIEMGEDEATEEKLPWE